MARRGQLSDEERELLAAQVAQTRSETAAQQQKLALAARELGIRQQATTGELTASAAKTAREAELTPYEKLLSLSKMSESDTQERMNQLRVAAEVMGVGERARTEESKIVAQREDRAAASRANIQSDLISHLAQRGDVPLSTLAETLRAGGQPEFATGLEKADVAKREQAFQTLKQQVPIMQQKGKLNELLAGVDDETRERLKPFITETQKDVVPPAPIAQHIGTLSKFGAMGLVGPALLSTYGASKLAAPVGKALVNSDFWKDFYKGLTQ